MMDATRNAIQKETFRAKIKHPNAGVEEATLDRNVAILCEETGEVAEAAMNLENAAKRGLPDLVLDEFRTKLYDELTQVASVATRWMETL